MEKKLKNRLSEIIKEKDIRPGWLAKQVGVEYMSVYRWCKQIHQPDAENLIILCNVLECSVNEIMVPK